MWIVSWDPFLMKKLLKMKFVGPMNSTRVHCSQEKSTLTAKKRRRRRRRRTHLLRATVAWVPCPKRKRWNAVNAETKRVPSLPIPLWSLYEGSQNAQYLFDIVKGKAQNDKTLILVSLFCFPFFFISLW